MRKDNRTSGTEIMHWMTNRMRRKSWDLFFGTVKRIVHVHLYDKRRRCFPTFYRPCGRLAPISGEIESGELPKVTAIREIREEIGIAIDHIYTTGHSFLGISPKGKWIHGITCLASLPDKIDSEAFTFNNEISGFIWASPNDALRLLARQADFLEGYHGLLFLLRSGIIDIPLTRPFLQVARKAQR